MSVTKTANGVDYDNDNFIYFDSAINSHWTTDLRLDVTSNSGGALGNFTVTQYGVWTGSTAPTSVTAAMASTRFGADQNGQNAAFTLTWGVNTAELVSSPTFTYGDTIATGASNTTTVSPAGGTGCQLDVGYKVVGLAISEKGSGYTTAPSIAFSTNGGGETRAVGTTNLTTDSGRIGGGGNAATYQENAIIIRAKTTSGGTSKVGDIQAQKGSRRYKVKTADGTAVCKLVATTSPAVNEGYIVATATGGTYYVTKLTRHKATLVAKTGDAALDGLTVKWTFGSPSATVVQIENA
jgi:hypothetical protein